MRFKAHEKTVFSAVILILLCINLLPVLTVNAGPPPGKGKPNKGSIDITFIEGGNLVGVVKDVGGSLDDNGRLTFARAHREGFSLEFRPSPDLDGFWRGYEGPLSKPPVEKEFSGIRKSRDFQISIDWTGEEAGDISFYYWFDWDGDYGTDYDHYRLVVSGEIKYNNVNGKGVYSLIKQYNAEIQYQWGRGKKSYDVCWTPPPDVPITFTFDIPLNE